MRIREFTSSSGLKILVGQDDASNDELTFKIGKSNDLWFHVSGSPGSHVLLKSSETSGTPDKESIREAAELAAWFSKMRQGGKIAVKYCFVQNVKKPRGAKPGSVHIYKDKTILVRPKEPQEPDQ
jgi:predicted ribosome quality control (RQC) complex YloA/Tae2 family protein